MIFREYRILRITDSDVANKIKMRFIFGLLIIFLAYMYYYEVNGTELRCKCPGDKKLPRTRIMLGDFWTHRESGGPGCNGYQYLLYFNNGGKHGRGVCLAPDHHISKWLDTHNDGRWYNVNITKQPGRRTGGRGPGQVNITLIAVKQ